MTRFLQLWFLTACIWLDSLSFGVYVHLKYKVPLGNASTQNQTGTTNTGSKWVCINNTIGLFVPKAKIVSLFWHFYHKITAMLHWSYQFSFRLWIRLPAKNNKKKKKSSISVKTKIYEKQIGCDIQLQFITLALEINAKLHADQSKKTKQKNNWTCEDWRSWKPSVATSAPYPHPTSQFSLYKSL